MPRALEVGSSFVFKKSTGGLPVQRPGYSLAIVSVRATDDVTTASGWQQPSWLRFERELEGRDSRGAAGVNVRGDPRVDIGTDPERIPERRGTTWKIRRAAHGEGECG